MALLFAETNKQQKEMKNKGVRYFWGDKLQSAWLLISFSLILLLISSKRAENK